MSKKKKNYTNTGIIHDTSNGFLFTFAMLWFYFDVKRVFNAFQVMTYIEVF